MIWVALNWPICDLTLQIPDIWVGAQFCMAGGLFRKKVTTDNFAFGGLFFGWSTHKYILTHFGWETNTFGRFDFMMLISFLHLYVHWRFKHETLVSVGHLFTHANCHQVLVVFVEQRVLFTVVVWRSNVEMKGKGGSVIAGAHSLGRMILYVVFWCRRVCWECCEPRMLDGKSSFFSDY